MEGQDDNPNNKDQVKLILPPPPDSLYDMKQIQPENKKKILENDFDDDDNDIDDDDDDDDDEPRYVEN